MQESRKMVQIEREQQKPFKINSYKFLINTWTSGFMCIIILDINIIYPGLSFKNML